MCPFSPQVSRRDDDLFPHFLLHRQVPLLDVTRREVGIDRVLRHREIEDARRAIRRSPGRDIVQQKLLRLLGVRVRIGKLDAERRLPVREWLIELIGIHGHRPQGVRENSVGPANHHLSVSTRVIRETNPRGDPIVSVGRNSGTNPGIPGENCSQRRQRVDDRLLPGAESAVMSKAIAGRDVWFPTQSKIQRQLGCCPPVVLEVKERSVFVLLRKQRRILENAVGRSQEEVRITIAVRS